MNDKYLIAMDIDDTLLDSKLRISLKNKMAIRKAQKKGHYIALASGRPTPSMVAIARSLGISKTGYIISYNGACIIELATGKTIYSSSLNKNIAHELVDLSKEHNVHIHTYINDIIVTEENNQYTEIESTITGLSIQEVSSIKSAIDRDVVKMLMLDTPDRLKEVEKTLLPVLGHKLSMYRSKPFFLEFMGAGTDKGNSLSRLAAHLGVKQEKVIAIGDSYNDAAMIQWAGLGVAMGNAHDDIKKIADYITDDHNKSGVASVISKFVLHAKGTQEQNQ